MALPIKLSVGQIAVYGDGNEAVTDNGTVIQGNQRYGTVYNIWAGGETYVYGNDKIIFYESDVVCRVVTSNNLTYTILPAARIVTEDIVVPP
jgi:hypothetical protein